MNIHELKTKIERLEKKLQKKENIRKEKQILFEKNKKEILDREKEIEKLDKIIELYLLTAAFAREQSKAHIEALVTSCLRTVFSDNIEFKIEMKGEGRAQAYFLIKEKIGDITAEFEPQEARGGGLVDLVSLALRISLLLRHQPPVEGLLLLDEPAKHVSEEYIHNVAELLLQIADEFDLQIILVTHNRHLAYMSEKVYEVNYDNNHSSVEKLIIGVNDD